MRLNELRAQLDSADDGGISAPLVMVMDRSNGMLFEVKGVETEQHEDGSSTVWVRVEEY